MTSNEMNITLDWDKWKNIEKKAVPKKKKETKKNKKLKKTPTNSKSAKNTDKIGSEFINSIKYNHSPGILSIEIAYSQDNNIEDKQGIHVKNLNKAQIQGLKNILNIFDD